MQPPVLAATNSSSASPGAHHSKTLPWLAVNPNTNGFVETESGRKFVPWGFNYDHDYKMRLLEEYWDEEWQTVVEDFREMKDLGANVVRIHLQFAQFMESPDKPNERSLRQLAKLVELAEATGVYLDLTGLGCYRKSDVPAWYNDLNEAARWRSQARFWEAIARRCKDSPAIFCYDLMNEPFVPGAPRARGDWLTGKLSDFYFVQALTLDPAGRTPPAVAAQWASQLATAIRKQDRSHLITIGMLPISGRASVEAVAQHLDFISVHEYPKSGKLEESLARLKTFSVGKPLVVEEVFPLHCSPKEVQEFIRTSRPEVAGWISFYWGKTPGELGKSSNLADKILLEWLNTFGGSQALLE